MKEKIKERMFTWMPEWKNGEIAHGGIWYRSDLGQFIQRVEKETGEKVVGINIIPDSDNEEKYSWNIEIITKEAKIK